jgi:hypothetical protein
VAIEDITHDVAQSGVDLSHSRLSNHDNEYIIESHDPDPAISNLKTTGEEDLSVLQDKTSTPM